MLAAALLVLNHVAVINVIRGAVEPDRAVQIEAGRIRSIAAASSYHAPSGATVFDLPGRFVTPGFIDMHVHALFPPLDEDGRPLPVFDRDTSLQLLRALPAYGITTIRDPGDATEPIVTVRGMIARGAIEGPEILTAGRILNTGSFRHAIYAPVNSDAEVRAEVAWQAAAGVDFIKVYQDMPPELVRAAIDEAHKRGLRVIGHVQATTWTEAARMGIDFLCHAAPWSTGYLSPEARRDYHPDMFGRVYWLEHLDLDADSIREMIAALVEHHVSVDPTLMAFRTKFWGDDPRYTDNPDRFVAPPRLWAGFATRSNTAGWTPAQYAAARAQWPKLLALVKRMFDAGVLLTAGTDTPFPWIIPGVSFHEELRLLASAGIPAQDVLRMATINAARALRKEAEIGTVEAGKRADLVILDGNPLVDIGNTKRIEMVLQAGRIDRRMSQ
jgi:imidazolonepropionase-like amidohydrolase